LAVSLVLVKKVAAILPFATVFPTDRSTFFLKPPVS